MSSRLFQGLGLRVAIDLVERDRVEVVIGGVTFGVSRQVAQALAQERKAHVEALQARGAAAPAELAEAERREQAAVERAAAADAEVAKLEAELAEERGARAADRQGAIRAGVEAAHRELAAGPCGGRGPFSPRNSGAHGAGLRGAHDGGDAAVNNTWAGMLIHRGSFTTRPGLPLAVRLRVASVL